MIPNSLGIQFKEPVLAFVLASLSIFSPSQVSAGAINDTQDEILWMRGGTGPGGISSLDLSIDGKRMVTAESLAGIKLWDIATGRLLKTLTDGTNNLQSAAISPDGTLAVGLRYDGAVTTWRLTDGALLSSSLVHQPGFFGQVCFSPDGKWYATAGPDRIIMLWSVHDGSLRVLPPLHSLPNLLIGFSSDSTLLASTSWDQRVALWQVSDASLLRSAKTKASYSLAFVPGGSQVALGAFEGIRFLSTEDWNVNQVLTGQANPSASLAFSSNGQMLGCISQNGEARLYDLHTSTNRLVQPAFTSTDRITGKGLDLSDDGKVLVFQDEQDGIQCLRTDSTTASEPISIHGDICEQVRFSHDGRWLATADPSFVNLLQASDGSLVRRWAAKRIEGNNLCFSKDSSLLALGCEKGQTLVWRTSDGSTALSIPSQSFQYPEVSSVAFSPDSGILATGGRNATIRLFRASDGKPLLQLDGHQDGVNSLEFSPDGSLLASGSRDTTCTLWRVQDGVALRTLRGHTHWVQGLSFSPDGKSIASAGYDNSLRLWSVEAGTLLRTLAPGGHVGSVCFSPDGLHLLATVHNIPSSLQGAVQIWRVADGALLHDLKNEALVPKSARFSPDAMNLAYGRMDGSVVVKRNPLASSNAPAVLAIKKLGKSLSVQVQGAAGSQYRLQSSLDLVRWTDLQLLTGDGENSKIEISPAEGQARFFRTLRQ